MQLYYIITKSDTEFIRFSKTEVEKFTQNVAKGFDAYAEAKLAMIESLERYKADPSFELVDIDRADSGTIKHMVFRQPEFYEDHFGNKFRSVREMFIVKAVV